MLTKWDFNWTLSSFPDDFSFSSPFFFYFFMNFKRKIKGIFSCIIKSFSFFFIKVFCFDICEGFPSTSSISVIASNTVFHSQNFLSLQVISINLCQKFLSKCYALRNSSYYHLFTSLLVLLDDVSYLPSQSCTMSRSKCTLLNFKLKWEFIEQFVIARRQDHIFYSYWIRRTFPHNFPHFTTT